jgi:hypothetical protein
MVHGIEIISGETINLIKTIGICVSILIDFIKMNSFFAVSTAPVFRFSAKFFSTFHPQKGLQEARVTHQWKGIPRARMEEIILRNTSK